MYKLSWPYRSFLAVNYVFLISLGLLCILPLMNVLSISLSSGGAAAAGMVKLWPVDFNLNSYGVVLRQGDFFHAFGVSVQRLLLGTVIGIFVCVLAAYPLSKDNSRFPMRTVYAWGFVFTILFSGGLIPWYFAVKQTHLLDSIWGLVLPGAVNVFHIILLLNFFRGVPKEMEESSLIDGAGHWVTLWRIYMPVSLPVLATVTLFTLVGHWNSWFDGLILMKNPDHYPLATYLQSTAIDSLTIRQMQFTNPEAVRLVSDRTGRAAQIFMTALPIMIVYPILQRYFISGIVLGSVKE